MNKWALLKQFAWPELKSILGNYYKNFIICTLIFFIAFIAIGLGNGVTNYLRIKMDNPFIKFINVIIPYNTPTPDINKLRDIKSRFNYGEVTPIYMSNLEFKGVNKKDCYAYARCINTDEELYKYIVSNKDLMLTDITNNTFKNASWGCVVTKMFLKKLGYNDLNIPYINFIKVINNKDYLLPIPICAVVSQLPDYTDILISEKFYNAMSDLKQLDVTDDNHKNYLKLFIFEDTEFKNNESAIKKALKENNFNECNRESFVEGLNIKKNNLDSIEIEKEICKINKSFPSIKTIRLYDYDVIAENNTSSKSIDNISFSFKNLDSVRSFQHYLFENYKLKIDMNTIESKENFNLFEKLILLLSGSLIVFSVFSIIMFIINLILSHLEKNKKNLGTLKAFGLANIYIVILYTLISIILISAALTAAYLLSILLGTYILNFISFIFNIHTSGASIQFANYPLYILILLFLILPAIIIYIRLWICVSHKTPGDLIYERE